MIDDPRIIGGRLRNLRRALGFETQVAFAAELGIEKNTYNPFEKGTRELTFETACLIRKKFKIPVDWVFWGDDEELPYHIKVKLEARRQAGLAGETADAGRAEAGGVAHGRKRLRKGAGA